MTAPPPFAQRQSNLATFSRCALSARFEIEAGDRYSAEMTRGTLAHRVQAECLRTMRRQGYAKIPQEEAIQIMFEVVAQIGVPSEEVVVLTSEERLNLLQFTIRWATDYEWDVRRVLLIEEQLELPIRCEDGVTRVLTGTPDLILAAPPNGLVVQDTKSGWGPQKEPREADPREPRRYLSARGMYQLDAYGLLGMHKYPRAEQVTLLETHPRAGQERRATLERSDMAEVERMIGIDLMLMDRALSEGPDSPIWKPVPGVQCRWCINRTACPRPANERGQGAIDSADMAQEYALDIEKLTPHREELIDAAKAWVEVHGPIPLGDGRVLGWQNLSPKEVGEPAAPDASRGVCKWCGLAILKGDGEPDRRRQYHNADRGEADCSGARDRAALSRSFCAHIPETPSEDAVHYTSEFEANLRVIREAQATA